MRFAVVPLVALCWRGAASHIRGRHNDKRIAAAVGWECYQQATALPTFTAERFPFCQVLEAGKAVLYWDHDHRHSTRSGRSMGNATLTIALVLRVMGGEEADWVALGLSSEGSGMKGLDVAMLWTEGGKAAVLEDRYSLDYEAPRLDGKQDKMLVESSMLPALPLTSFVFTMPASNCGDKEEDVRVRPSVGVFVTYAYGKEVMDQPSAAAGSTTERMAATASPSRDRRQPAYHTPAGRGGGVSIPLLLPSAEWQQLSKKVTLPPDAQVMRATLADFEVPSDRVTTYMCKYLQPPSDRKYHIYDAQLIKGQASRHHVLHHTTIFLVYSNQPKPLEQPFDCTDNSAEQFAIPFVIATIGGLWTPADRLGELLDTAMPFGGQNMTLYWLLEVHYENVQRLQGMRDTTGLEVVYSPTLRRHDIGLMAIGKVHTIPPFNITSALVLPPGKPSVDSWGLCTSTCLGRMLPAGSSSSHPAGVGGGSMRRRRVVAAGLHMHSAGREGEVWVEHADGTSHLLVEYRHFELRTASTWRYFPIGDEDDGEEAAGWPYVGPGDRVLTRCNYDTSDRTNVTRWGPSGSRDEMCIGLVLLTPMGDSSPVFACLDLNGVRYPSLDNFERMMAKLQHASTPTVPNNLSVCITTQQLTRHYEAGTLADVRNDFVLGTAPADLSALQTAKATDTSGRRAAREGC